MRNVSDIAVFVHTVLRTRCNVIRLLVEVALKGFLADKEVRSRPSKATVNHITSVALWGSTLPDGNHSR
jgi:hypothetical protein